ncbi:unnamed protein product [Peronospora destructor]|uniref:Uncharacterized protein n=1 Tax=Peronospora destructor TaxID=86335 RepID=A0AAV0T876_9STRA|nr:unnamed protein product [Peronospora destructor]
MNAPSSPWSGSKVSRLWSAKGDECCSPPRSDDYKYWSLMQLKREITQRQLKTNPRKRNKDAFVRVLLQNDQEQTKARAQTPIENIKQTQQQTLNESVMLVPTSTSELQNMYVTSGTQQQGIYETNEGNPQQQQELYLDHQSQSHQLQQQEPIYVDNGEQQPPQIFTNCGVMQAARLTPLASAPPAQTSSQVQTQNSVLVAANVAPALESKVASFQATKRQRMEEVGQESEESETVNIVVASETIRNESTAQQSGKGVTEYLRRKLSVQAARLEIESRRLDLETKREQRNSELHAVQLALAQEQLQQAEITTQKMKTEWMVEQMIQKKRLNDAGISQNDSTNLGMYMS